jgi:hypothetical protein
MPKAKVPYFNRWLSEVSKRRCPRQLMVPSTIFALPCGCRRWSSDDSPNNAHFMLERVGERSWRHHNCPQAPQVFEE